MPAQISGRCILPKSRFTLIKNVNIQNSLLRLQKDLFFGYLPNHWRKLRYFFSNFFENFKTQVTLLLLLTSYAMLTLSPAWSKLASKQTSHYCTLCLFQTWSLKDFFFPYNVMSRKIWILFHLVFIFLLP